MNHRPRGLIRSSPKSELPANGSLHPSAETSTPCASNYVLARQPLEGFQCGTLHAHRVRRTVSRRSAVGLQQSGRQPPRSRARRAFPQRLSGRVCGAAFDSTHARELGCRPDESLPSPNSLTAPSISLAGMAGLLALEAVGTERATGNELPTPRRVSPAAGITPRRADSPRFRDDSPSSRDDSPSSRDDSPSSRDDSPSFGDDSPRFRDDSPSFRDDSPGFSGPSPTLSRSVPCPEYDATLTAAGVPLRELGCCPVETAGTSPGRS